MDERVAAGAAAGAGAGFSRRQALARLAALGIGLPAAARLLTACGDDPGDEGATPSSTPRPSSLPNLVVVIVDDLRYDDLEHLPRTRRLVQDEGVTFTQARCNVALCQPSRVAFFTGQMSKHNGELAVGFAGTTLRDRDNTVAKWLHDAGYRCGLFGKYINYFDGAGGVDPPAGFDAWFEQLDGSGPDDFRVRTADGLIGVSGQYDADYLAERAVEFLAAGDDPFFCILAPREAHAPFHPRADLADAFADAEREVVLEEDVSDKPPWIQEQEPITEEMVAQIQEDHRGTMRELAAVDEMVETVLTSMDDDRLGRTVVVVTSDNGVYRGEHRRPEPGAKSGPYEVAVHVPMIVRGSGFPAGTDVDAPVLAFQDLTATLVELAGATAGLPDQTGVALTAIASDAEAHRDRALLHEIGPGYFDQTADGVTTGPDHPLGFRKLFRYP